MEESQRKLRYEVINFFFKECRPPTIQDLTALGCGDATTVRQGLKDLADAHHIKLYSEGVQSPSPISMAHPFSHLPSPYVVTSQGKTWWANCAWCALGLASMLEPNDVTVHILTESGQLVNLEFRNGQLQATAAQKGDYWVVFSAEPSTWWHDVRYACSGIQICTSRQDADLWHGRHGFPVGDIISLEQLWQLSKAWYHDKHTYEYTRKTPQEKEALFKEIGLVSSYWSS